MGVNDETKDLLYTHRLRFREREMGKADERRRRSSRDVAHRDDVMRVSCDGKMVEALDCAMNFGQLSIYLFCF